jgi:hypothetical protein
MAIPFDVEAAKWSKARRSVADAVPFFDFSPAGP